MASASVVPSFGLKATTGTNNAVDKLPDEMNDMKIKDDKVNYDYALFSDLYVSCFCYSF